MILRPVSSIWTCVSCSSKVGGGRWIDWRSPATSPRPSRGTPSTLKSRPSVPWPVGTAIGRPVSRGLCPPGRAPGAAPGGGARAGGRGDRPAGVDGLCAAAQAVGGVHGEAAHPVVPQVLLHLRHELLPVHLDLDRVVKVGQFLRRELYVHHRADDLSNVSFSHGHLP